MKTHFIGWTVWSMVIIPALERLRQRDHKCKANWATQSTPLPPTHKKRKNKNPGSQPLLSPEITVRLEAGWGVLTWEGEYATQARECEFKPQNTCIKKKARHCTRHPETGARETGRSLGFTAQVVQPNQQAPSQPHTLSQKRRVLKNNAQGRSLTHAGTTEFT